MNSAPHESAQRSCVPCARGAPGPCARAFSILEVLLGLLILAIGLLGVGAIIPAVIGQQRTASETALAVAAIDAAETAIRARGDLQSINSGRGGLIGIGELLQDTNWSATNRWELPDNNDALIEPDTGTLLIPADPSSNTVQVRIPQVDRLWPSATSSLGGAPRFVWDIALRRATPQIAQAQFGPQRVQLALFLRRIDPGIVVRSGFTLTDVLTDPSQAAIPGLSNTDFRLAVAADQAMPNGTPTLRGIGPGNSRNYAAPFDLDVNFNPTLPDRLEVPTSQTVSQASPQQRTLIAQVGQTIVDNLGNIYTVRRVTSIQGGTAVPATQAFVLYLDPPVSSGVTAMQLKQVIAVAPAPVAVRVIDLTLQSQPTGGWTGSGLP